MWWLLLASSVYHLTGAEVTITAAENSSYYVNASLVLTCNFSGFSDLPLPTTFGLRYSNADLKTVKLGCQYDTKQIAYRSYTSEYTGQLISPTDTDCQRIFPNTSPNPNFQLRVNFTLIQAGDYECEFNGGPGQVSISSPFKIIKLRVEPSRIELSLTPESGAVIAGDELSVSCTSSGGSPASTFTYEIGGEQLSGRTFTAESKHNGKTVGCLDTEHSRYLGRRPTTQAEGLLTVYYIELDGGDRENVVRNPCDQNKHILNCSVRVNAAGGAQVQFAWTKNGSPFQHRDKTYEIPLSNLTQSGTTDTYNCTAQVTLLTSTKTVTKRFEIKWDSSAHDCITTTRTPITTGGTSVTIIICVVVGVLLIVVIVGLIVFFVKRKGSGVPNAKGYVRANAGGEGRDSEMPSDAKTNVDSRKTPPPIKPLREEKRTNKGDNAPKKNADRPKSRELLYAELDLSGDPGIKKKQAPDRVVYADIDFSKSKTLTAETPLIYAEIDRSNPRPIGRPLEDPVEYAQIDPDKSKAYHPRPIKHAPAAETPPIYADIDHSNPRPNRRPREDPVEYAQIDPVKQKTHHSQRY